MGTVEYHTYGYEEMKQSKKIEQKQKYGMNND
jgi:hypothetical protein